MEGLDKRSFSGMMGIRTLLEITFKKIFVYRCIQKLRRLAGVGEKKKMPAF